MNREIKFRIWDNHHKQWVGGCAIELDGTIIDIHHAEPETNCIAQQYTGLKDSNGVEIFEGDIILDEWAQDDPFSNTPDVPRYEHKIFEVKYIEGCFNLKKDPIKHRCSYNFKRKVVGNIFENKDLLPIPVQIKETLNDEEFSTSEMIELLLNKV
jgi:uncharacterized phage protein (TIGR01671 family)